MDFSEALLKIKKGNLVSRSEDSYIRMSKIRICSEGEKTKGRCNDDSNFIDHICFKKFTILNSDEQELIEEKDWRPNANDMLAEDWEVIQ